MKKPGHKKLIRDHLESLGHFELVKKIKSVTYETFAGGSAIRIKTVNCTKVERETLNKELAIFSYGTFDAMTDCEGVKDFHHERAAKFLTITNEFTDDLKDLIKKELELNWTVVDDESSQRVFNCWYEQIIWRKLCEI